MQLARAVVLCVAAFEIACAADDVGRGAPSQASGSTGSTYAPPLDVGPPPSSFCSGAIGDEVFACIAEQEPAFAGVYVSDGRLVVMLTDVGRLDSTLGVLAAVYGASRFQPFLPARAEEASFGWTALFGWRVAAAGAFNFRTVLSLDIDEVTNRLVVGTSDKSEVSAIADWLAAQDIPREATDIQVVEPVQYL